MSLLDNRRTKETPPKVLSACRQNRSQFTKLYKHHQHSNTSDLVTSSTSWPAAVQRDWGWGFGGGGGEG